MRTYRTKQEYQQEKDMDSARTVGSVMVLGALVWALWFVLTHYVEIAAWIFGLGGGK